MVPTHITILWWWIAIRYSKVRRGGTTNEEKNEMRQKIQNESHHKSKAAVTRAEKKNKSYTQSTVHYYITYIAIRKLHQQHYILPTNHSR